MIVVTHTIRHLSGWLGERWGGLLMITCRFIGSNGFSVGTAWNSREPPYVTGWQPVLHA
jgi:hypothetical protein